MNLSRAYIMLDCLAAASSMQMEEVESIAIPPLAFLQNQQRLFERELDHLKNKINLSDGQVSSILESIENEIRDFA